MAQNNLLDLLTGEGETINFIQSLVNTTLSAEEILSKLSDAGLSIRRTVGLQAISYLRNTVIPSQSYIANVNLNALPNLTRLPQSLTKQLRNFAYRVTLQGISQLTGEQREQFITISSNQLLTKQQAIDAAVAYGEGDDKSGGLDGATGQVTDVFVNSAGLVAP